MQRSTPICKQHAKVTYYNAYKLLLDNSHGPISYHNISRDCVRCT